MVDWLISRSPINHPVLPQLPTQCPDYDIRSEPQCFLSHRLGIAVDFRIIPPIAWIRFIRIIDNEASPVKDSETLRGLAVVFVCLWDAIREVEMTAVQPVRERKLRQLLVGKHFFDLAAKGLIHAVIIIRVQESAVHQVRSQSLDLIVGECDIAVTSHEEKRIGKEFLTRDVDELISRCGIDGSVGPNEFQEIDLLGLIIVPVPAAAVLEPGDAELALDPCLGGGRRGEQEPQKDGELE